MKYLLIAVAVMSAVAGLLAACGGPRPTEQIPELVEKGCVIKERKDVSQSCNRYGNCTPIRGTVFSCPAFEVTVRD